ncbi:MAG: zinc ribbon domain-containing protein [Methanomicrobium sp.]|nr:zinc ribbon domain-containing protein [Methanomicrobium sp.]
MDENDEHICQSCGMPVKNHNDFGTEKNGKKSPYYCTYCYMKGQFIEPELTPSEMVEVCARKYDEMKVMPFDEAYELNLKIIPHLRRWKFK